MLFRNFSQIECRAGWRMFCRVQLTAVWALLQSANGLTASPRALASSSSSLMMMMVMAMMTPMARIVMVMTMMVTYVRAPMPCDRASRFGTTTGTKTPKGKSRLFLELFFAYIHAVANFVPPLQEKHFFGNANNHLFCCFLYVSYKYVSMISIVKIRD